MNGKGSTVPPLPPRLLNLGCGSALHPEWINLDSAATAPGVIAHDLRCGLPFPPDSFDAAYGSHVLEHLEPDAAARLLRECHRILRPGGILRIVVPNLEVIARLYLDSLERAATGDIEAVFRYDWMMLELYDQVVRTKPGGRMATYLRSALVESHARFVGGRIGDEATGGNASRVEEFSSVSRMVRTIRSATSAARRAIARACAVVALGPEGGAALGEGLFRRSGEVHQWMYDRFSMRRALERAGFVDVRVCAAGQSDISDFVRHGLEVRNGKVRKPDSLFMEGHKQVRP